MPKDKFETQTKTDDVHVKVRSDVDRGSGQPTSDFLIAERDGSGGHDHVVIDHDGNTVSHTTR